MVIGLLEYWSNVDLEGKSLSRREERAAENRDLRATAVEFAIKTCGNHANHNYLGLGKGE